MPIRTIFNKLRLSKSPDTTLEEWQASLDAGQQTLEKGIKDGSIVLGSAGIIKATPILMTVDAQILAGMPVDPKYTKQLTP